MIWEREILRKAYGPTYESGYWRIKMSWEIYNKFKSPDIVTVINVYRLECLGHVVRMDGKKTVKKLLEGQPGGGRWKRRSRLTRMDVEWDLRNMGVKRWRTRCFDRTEWPSVMRENKANFKGLQCYRSSHVNSLLLISFISGRIYDCPVWYWYHWPHT